MVKQPSRDLESTHIPSTGAGSSQTPRSGDTRKGLEAAGDHPRADDVVCDELAIDDDRDPLEELAEEFADRQRRGERVKIEDYVREHPELADEIRELFPTIAAMERVTRQQQHASLTSRRRPHSIPDQLGDFRVLHEIGRGGMGIVYEAEQVTLGRRVAVKVLPKQSLRSDKDMQRFYREAHTAAKLHHTNIVPIFGAGEQEGVHYIVMQLIRGMGLDEILDELRRIVLGQDAVGRSSKASGSARSDLTHRNASALLYGELRHPADGSTRGKSRRPIAAKPDNANVHSASHEPTTSVLDTGRDSSAAASVDDGPSSDLPAPEINDRSGSESAKAAVGESTVVENGQPHEHTGTVEVSSTSPYWRNVAQIGVQVASALEYAHGHRTLHRDVKPANLLLDDEGIVWVADFGLAKAMEQDSITWTDDIVGTLSYMAPERFQGVADERGDIYSLGLTLYELVTLRRAWDGADRATLIHQVTTQPLKSPRRLNRCVPRDLETIVMKAVATEPSDRYQSAEAMAHDLQSFLEDRPILARRVPPIERFVRWSRRNRAVAALSATVAVLLVLVSVVASIGFVRENRERLKAQTTSHLAVGALENIYSQFAPAPLQTPGEESIEGEDGDTLLAAQPQLPLSKDVARLLENLLDFYDQLSTEAGDDPSVLVKSIMASRRVGDIHHRLGELDKATAAYERAIRRYESAKDRLSSDVDANLELARIHNGMGLVQSMSQSHGAAARSHQLAVDIVREQTDDEESRLELARTYYLLDMASEGMRRQRRNRPDGNGKPNRGQSSCDHLSKAVAILEHSMDNLAEQPEHAFLLARCYLTIAERLGRESPSDSHEHYETAVRLLEQLVAAYPDVPDYRCELGDAYARPVYYRLWRKRDAERSLSDLADSESRLRKALEVTSDLELDHPNIPRYLAFKSRLHQTLGCVLRDADNPEEARRHFQDAIQNQNLIVRLDPNNSWNLVHRARLQLDQAGVLTELHELDQAFSVARAAVNRLESLPLDDSNQDRFLHFMCQRNVWDGYRQLEQIAMLQGRPLEPEFQARLDEMRDRMPPDPERRGR